MDTGRAIITFVRQHAPDVWHGLPVRFFATFTSTVTTQIAFGSSSGSDLVPALNLEIWGVPTSQLAYDPHNHGFVYQRFQRGIMQYDASSNCTQGILLADYLKAILTGQNLPADLAQEAANSPFFDQYDPNAPGWVRNPSLLPNTDLTDAFTSE